MHSAPLCAQPFSAASAKPCPGEQQLRPRVAEVEGDLALLEQRVHRDGDGAEAQGPIERDREVRNVREHDPDAVAGLDALRPQQPRDPLGRRVERAVRDDRVVEADRGPVGDSDRGVHDQAGQVRHRLSLLALAFAGRGAEAGGAKPSSAASTSPRRSTSPRIPAAASLYTKASYRRTLAYASVGVSIVGAHVPARTSASMRPATDATARGWIGPALEVSSRSPVSRSCSRNRRGVTVVASVRFSGWTVSRSAAALVPEARARESLTSASSSAPITSPMR